MKIPQILTAGFLTVFIFTSCFSGGNESMSGGEVIGVSGRPFDEPTPYGMVKVERGFLKAGLEKNDTLWGIEIPGKEISVDGF